MPTETSDFWKLFKPMACSVRLRAVERDEILAEVVDNFVRARLLDEALRESAVRALLERERIASTGVGMNVAIPHVKLAGIRRAIFSLSVHPEGAEWSALDGEPVRLLFSVLRPEAAGDEHDPERHLEMMRWIARLARDADFRRFALAARNRTELVDLLKEMSGY